MANRNGRSRGIGVHLTNRSTGIVGEGPPEGMWLELEGGQEKQNMDLGRDRGEQSRLGFHSEGRSRGITESNFTRPAGSGAPHKQEHQKSRRRRPPV
jgi:hypothetical protein